MDSPFEFSSIESRRLTASNLIETRNQSLMRTKHRNVWRAVIARFVLFFAQFALYANINFATKIKCDESLYFATTNW